MSTNANVSMERAKRLARELGRSIGIKHMLALEIVARAMKFSNFHELSTLHRKGGPALQARFTVDELPARLLSTCLQKLHGRLDIDVTEDALSSAIASLGSAARLRSNDDAASTTDCNARLPRFSRAERPERQRRTYIAYVGDTFVSAKGCELIVRKRRKRIPSEPMVSCGSKGAGRVVLQASDDEVAL